MFSLKERTAFNVTLADIHLYSTCHMPGIVLSVLHISFNPHSNTEVDTVTNSVMDEKTGRPHSFKCLCF